MTLRNHYSSFFSCDNGNAYAEKKKKVPIFQQYLQNCSELICFKTREEEID